MIPKYHKDLLWAKELLALVFIMLLSLLHLKEGSWLVLIVACFVLFCVAHIEEQRFQSRTPGYMYFCLTSSYFVFGALFFTASFFMLKTWMSGWQEVVQAAAIILFSIGLARIVFSKSLRPFHGL